MDAEYLASLRADALRDLQETGVVATVIPVTEADTVLGGQSSTPGESTDYPCRLLEMPKLPVERREGGGGIASIGIWQVILPWDADAPNTGTITVDGEVFQITDNNKGRTEQTVVTVWCKKVD